MITRTEEIVPWLPMELTALIERYAEPTLCDLLQHRFGDRFLLIEPVAPDTHAIGTLSGLGQIDVDLFAKWIVFAAVSAKTPAGRVYGSEHGYDCVGSLVGAPSPDNYDFTATLKEQYLSLHHMCLSYRPAEEDSHYLYLHARTNDLVLVANDECIPLGPIMKLSSALLINHLLRWNTIEDSSADRK
jgi:hypothetical protein